MTEEKQLLIKSMHKLIKHVQLGPKYQAEIFASFSSKDIQKIVKNIQDSNIQLRKASFSLIVHLLSGKNSELRNKFCIHFKIPLITGKVILNPKVLSNLDLLDLRQIINLTKFQNNLHKQYENMQQFLWYINLVDYPLRFQELTINILDKIDPKYCIFGITVLSSDNSQYIYSQSLKAQQQTRSSLHGNNMILMENFCQQSNSTDFPQSQINTNFLKSNIYKQPQISSLQFEKRRLKQNSKNKVVLSHRQHQAYQQNIRQNNSLDKNIKSSIPTYKNEQNINKNVETSSQKEANNSSISQNNDLSIIKSDIQSQSHEIKMRQRNNPGLNNYFAKTAFQNNKSDRTYQSPYNLQNPPEYSINTQKEKIYPIQYYQSPVYRHIPDNQFKTEGILSPTYYKSIGNPVSPNVKSITNYNTQYIVNSQAKLNFAHSMNFSQSNTGKKQYYSINNNHLPSSQSNTRPVVYLNSVRPREQVRYNYQYSRQY